MGGFVIRPVAEADIPWIVDRVGEKQKWLSLGSLDSEYVSNAIRGSNSFTDGQSVILGIECPVVSSQAPAVNQAWFWHGEGGTWPLLAKHEAASSLPSMVSVPWKHKRREALMRALQSRGYEPFELNMVKHD